MILCVIILLSIKKQITEVRSWTTVVGDCGTRLFQSGAHRLVRRFSLRVLDGFEGITAVNGSSFVVQYPKAHVIVAT